MALPVGALSPRTDVSGATDAPSPSTMAKERALVQWLRERARVVIGFSGGVDSSYLAVVALEALGASNVLAVIGRSASYPTAQWETARQVAERFGGPVREIDTDEIHDPRYAANPSNRCYFCKSVLWETVRPVAAAEGYAVIVDGTNADDLGDHRPGAQAAREREVESPLASVGLGKEEIRILSRQRGLPTWAQPSSPCLSSRLPYGTAVTPERLRQVERAEAALRELGVTGDLRVRHHGELARVEVGVEQLNHWLDATAATRLADAVRAAGYRRVAIDLRGFRSGSLNVLGGVATTP